MTTTKSKVLWALQSLNFFMADIQAGIGPFLGIFLLAKGWQSGPIGTVMTIGGVELRRNGYSISAWAFLKYGLVVMLPALAVALAALWL